VKTEISKEKIAKPTKEEEKREGTQERVRQKPTFAPKKAHPKTKRVWHAQKGKDCCKRRAFESEYTIKEVEGGEKGSAHESYRQVHRHSAIRLRKREGMFLREKHAR